MSDTQNDDNLANAYLYILNIQRNRKNAGDKQDELPSLTTTQAAEILNVSQIAIRQHIRRGNLPAVKIGRDWLIAPADLEPLKNLEHAHRKRGRRWGKKDT